MFGLGTCTTGLSVASRAAAVSWGKGKGSKIGMSAGESHTFPVNVCLPKSLLDVLFVGKDGMLEFCDSSRMT